VLGSPLNDRTPKHNMPTQREVLQRLKRDELLDALDAFELEVADRRRKDTLVEALAHSRKARLHDVLMALPRRRLQEICQELGVDKSGREKAVLADRLSAASPKATPGSATPKTATPKKRATKTRATKAKPKPKAKAKAQPKAKTKEPSPEDVAQQAHDAAEKGQLTRELLERHLWSAADILRGSIDSADYKHFIFGLLFLKRLSDRFEEECELLRQEGYDPEDPDEHQFFVPPRARWSEIRKATENVGEALNTASNALEEKNTALEGVLAGIDFNDELKLGDSRQRDSTLHRLVLHFSDVDLRNASLSEPDLLGRAYEYLIEKFADDAGKKGGEFYTPQRVVRLLVEILDPQEGTRICDPTCGSGGMLIQSAQHIVRNGGHPRNFSLYGQEKNLGTWAICKMNMLLHSIVDFEIEKGDTIRDPKLLQDGELMLFDRVLANPPFSLDQWGHEEAEGDGYGRFRFGIPPKTKGDLAFVQHMVATLNAQGKLGVVMPHGVLFRGASEGRIRQGLLEEDLIEVVVGLPANLFYGTGIPASLLVVNREKPEERKGKVLFVEASREFRDGSNQNVLRIEDVEKVAGAVRAFEDVERYARVVGIEEIEKNEFNLNISRYVDTAEEEERVDVGVAVGKLREAERAREEAKGVMDGFLRELGYESP
jgi:type I restriction enzyme M protein